MPKSALTVLDQVTEVSQLVIQKGCFDLLDLSHLVFMQRSKVLTHSVFEVIDDLVSAEVVQIYLMG